MCVCGQPATHDPRLHEFLLECHYCADWFHGRCIHMSEVDAMDIVKFACPPCTKQGHATVKYQDSTPMADMDDLAYAPLPIQRHRFMATGPSYNATSYAFGSHYAKNSEPFRRTLRAAVFSRSGVRVLNAPQFNASYFTYHAFHEPLLIVDGNWTTAGLPRPFPVISLQDISSLLANSGATVRGIDVASQDSFQLSSTGWTSRLTHPNPDSPVTAQFRVLETGFRREVAPPVAVSEIDWHYLLPCANGAINREANPEIYGTLCGAGAFVDFTVSPDCKATWLAVSNGQVDVFVIEPTVATIDTFRRWREDPKVPFASVFLGDRVDRCTKVTVKGGATLVLPSGFIYALYAEHGGAFFTGFFANTLNLATHLDVWQRLEGSDARRAPQWRKTSFPHGWALQHPSPAVAPSPPLNAQLWSLVCHYINELSHMDALLRVGNLERDALRRAMGLLRQWSASARSIERLDNGSWLPSSLQDAGSLLDQLEQAIVTHTPPPDHTPPATSKSHGMQSITSSESGYLYGSQSDDDLWNTSAVSRAFATVSSSSSYHQESVTTPASPTLWDYPSYHEQTHPTHTPHHHGGPAAPMDPLAVPASSFYPSHLGDTPQFASALHGNGYSTANAPAYGDFLDPRSSPNGSHVGMLGAVHPLLDMGASPGGLHNPHVRHRASCHRCGNLRKKNVRCPKCPHIFCQKCTEKMIEEHGAAVFTDGCPVCKELCCCGKNRTLMCPRKFHCYKKCPATKRPSN